MGNNKIKIAGAVLAGTLALGALGGTCAFAADVPSMTTDAGTDTAAVTVSAQTGTAVLNAGQLTLTDGTVVSIDGQVMTLDTNSIYSLSEATVTLVPADVAAGSFTIMTSQAVE